MKNIQESLLDFFDSESTMIDDFQKFDDLITQYKIEENLSDLKFVSHLLLNIANNHHRIPIFINKIQTILLRLKNGLKIHFSNAQIIDIFGSSKLIIFSLFKSQVILPSEDTINALLSHKINFYSEIKNDEIDSHQANGENEIFLCQLIRNDSIIEFIKYINLNHIRLDSKIQNSKYETNSFLLNENNIELIEYAAFYGSIQIYQFLRLNNVKFRPNLWLFAIHGRNPEIIHLLEEDKVKLPNNSYIKCFEEAIKCYHNELADYILNNFLENIDQIFDSIFHYHNYSFLASNINDIKYELLLYAACKYNHFDLVNSILMDNEIILEVNEVNFLVYNQVFISAFFIKFLFIIYLITFLIIIFYLSTADYALKNDFFEIFNLLIFNQKVKISCKNPVFESAYHLKKLTIPSNATKINDCFFNGFSSLEQVAFESPSSLISIGNKSFYNCILLKQIIIPSTTISIGENAFVKCSSLTQVIFTLPSSLESIGNGAFNGCSSLEQCEIPSSVKTIGKNAFKGCKLLTFSTNSFISKKDNIFQECKQISKTNSEKSIKNDTINYNTSLKDITIPTSVKSIRKNSFLNCHSVTQIIIPSSVTFIGDNAFHKCSFLKQIKIPQFVTSIGKGAFSDCSSLEKIENYSSITLIRENTFCNCISLKEIIIPSSVISIGKNAFSNCLKISKIIIPPSVIYIEENAFEGCLNIEIISIPSSVNKIGNNAFFFVHHLNKLQTQLFYFLITLELIGKQKSLKFEFCNKHPICSLVAILFLNSILD